MAAVKVPEMQETWRDVPGFEGAYQVSDAGHVRSVDRTIWRLNRWGVVAAIRLKGRLLSPFSRESGGHKIVALGKGNLQFVHRLVLSAFVRPVAEGEEARHLDGDPANNRVENLAWGTRSENIQDRKRLGEENPPRGERNARARFSEADVRQIRSDVMKGRSFGQIAKAMGASRGSVGKVAMGYTWGWLPQ